MKTIMVKCDGKKCRAVEFMYHPKMGLSVVLISSDGKIFLRPATDIIAIAGDKE